MKNVWKRATSLVLSGVLLLGSVPVQAFATEEVLVEEIVEEVVQTQALESTVPPATSAPTEAPVELTLEEAVEKQPVQTAVQMDPVVDDVRNIQITGDTTVTTNEDTNTVTLNGQNVEAIDSTDEGTPLTVVLTEGTANSIQTLKAVNGIVITGKGVLKVGSIQAGENLEIADAVVMVGSDRGEEEASQTLITVKNTITISGDAHVKTAVGHTAVEFTDTAADAVCSVAGDGYCRTVAGGIFEEVNTGKTVGTMDYLEFVTAEHLSAAYNNTHHYLTCGEETCPLGGDVKILAEEHDILYSAHDNVIAAECSVCEATDAVSLKAESKVGDGQTPVEAVVEGPNGMMCKEAIQILYKNADIADAEATAEKPGAFGRYLASLTIEDKTVSVEFYIQKKITLEDLSYGKELVYTGEAQEPAVEEKNEDVTFEVVSDPKTNAGSYQLTVKGTGYYGGTANLPYTIAKAVPVGTVEEAQTVAAGICDFVEPVFADVNGENLPGALTYLYNGEELKYGDLKTELAAGFEGDQKIHYTFVPNDTENYETVKSEDPIVLTVKTVRFGLENSTITDQDVLNGNEWHYGDTPVDTTAIKAFVDDQAVSGLEYTVTYKKNGETVTDRPLPVGTYTFEITYTGTVGGVNLREHPVYAGNGTVEIKKANIELAAEPAGKHLTEEKVEEVAQNQNLMDPIVTETPEAAEVKYSVDNVNWSADIPQRAAAGRYTVYYKITAPNYEDKTGSVTTLIQPELKAVYGQTLWNVEIPRDGKWQWALNGSLMSEDELDDHSVGPYGVNNSFQMMYNGETTAFTVNIQVGAKPVDPDITTAKYIRYDEKNSVSLKLFDKVGTTNVEIPATEYTFTLNDPAENKRTGWTTISVADAKADGNYEIAAKAENVLIYRPGYMALTTLDTSALKDVEAYADTTSAGTVKKVKAALSGKIKSTEYPESAMKYFNAMMTYYGTQDGKTGWIRTRVEEYYPKGGFEIEIPYSELGTGISEANEFKVAIMDAETSAELGTTAGNPPKEIEDFSKTETGIKFHSDGCSVVAIAVKVDTTKPYKITPSILLNNQSSTKGSLSIKVGSNTATKKETEAKFGETVKVTASASTGYSVLSVKVTDSSGEEVKTTQSGSTYTFEMPASNVTVKLNLKKTTSTSKNANTGDSSNIHIWLTILAASAVGLVALVIVWWKKRKK